jgi:hypothetical protein
VLFYFYVALTDTSSFFASRSSWMDLLVFYTILFYSLRRTQCANSTTSLDTMDILLEMYPDGLEEPDKSGRLPFHLAVAHQTDLRFLKYLVEHYPECVEERTKFGVRCFVSL